MTREEALELLQQNTRNKNLLKHSLACEAVMRGLAIHFNEDEERWGLAGLLHDIDYDRTKDDPFSHSLLGGKMLAELGISEDIVYAVKAHNEVHGLKRISLMDKALFAVDPLTGLIAAGALITPEKKLDAVTVDFLKNKFDEKGFAGGASRIQIAACHELGLNMEEFLTIGLQSMQGIHAELEL